jgi:hypothetical protein
MPRKDTGPSEGVQIRLDPALKQRARHALTWAQMTWQDLLEPCVRQFVDAARTQAGRDVATSVLPRQDVPPPAVVRLDLTTLVARGQSLEIPLGSPTYRRWIHRCSRCEQLWVAEKAAPEKCVHCKSPYWHTPRTRRRAGRRRASETMAGDTPTSRPT